MRAVIGWKSVFYDSIKHKAELKLSRHLSNCTVRPFEGLLLTFFSISESKISEQASRQVATEEPNKGL